MVGFIFPSDLSRYHQVAVAPAATKQGWQPKAVGSHWSSFASVLPVYGCASARCWSLAERTEANTGGSITIDDWRRGPGSRPTSQTSGGQAVHARVVVQFRRTLHHATISVDFGTRCADLHGQRIPSIAGFRSLDVCNRGANERSYMCTSDTCTGSPVINVEAPAANAALL